MGWYFRFLLNSRPASEQAPDLVTHYVREFVQRASWVAVDDLLASLVLEGEMYEKLGHDGLGPVGHPIWSIKPRA